MPSEALQAVKDIVDTMHRTSVEVFESKKRALAAGGQALKGQVGEGKDPSCFRSHEKLMINFVAQ
jgi:hypothetical protein